MQHTAPAMSEEQLERSPFDMALAEYRAATRERDRLKSEAKGKWTPALGDALLAELDAWKRLGSLRFQ